jgi:RNA polymerase sigma factor (sigma-70 family)
MGRITKLTHLVRNARKAKGWRQKDLAQEAGLSDRSLWKVEAGRPVELFTLAKIAVVLKFELEEFLKCASQCGQISSKKDGWEWKPTRIGLWLLEWLARQHKSLRQLEQEGKLDSKVAVYWIWGRRTPSLNKLEKLSQLTNTPLDKLQKIRNLDLIARGLYRWRVGRLIKAARQKKGLTRQDLARLTGLTLQQLCYIEGKFTSRVPRMGIKRLLRLAKYLEIKTEAITGAYLKDLHTAGAKRCSLDVCPTRFSKLVRFKRLQLGLSPTELGKRSGISKKTIKKLETSKDFKASRKKGYIRPLAENLPVPEDYLLRLLEAELKEEKEQKIKQREQALERRLPPKITPETFNKLSERERLVLELRRRYTLEEIGQILGGITRKRVHQIEKRALEKLQKEGKKQKPP